MIRRLLTLVILALVCGGLRAGSFEGTIKLVKKTFYDTSYFYYQVKDNKVRIDEYNRLNVLIGSLIIDLDEETVHALNNADKVYKQLEPDRRYDKNENHYSIIKTDNTKNINGYICQQWRVRNREKNSEIVYWVTRDGFYFFEAMIRIMNNFGNCSEFFQHIPGTTGVLPMLTVERNMVRYEKLRLVITDIHYTTLSENIFQIPADFKRFEY